MSLHSRGYVSPVRGAALILVLWFVAALSIVAMSLSARVRIDGNGGRFVLAEIRAQALGDAAINLALAEIDAQPVGDGELFSKAYLIEGERIIVQSREDTAFINLNHAPARLLAQLFATLGGLSMADAERVAENVVAWRTPSTGGAVVDANERTGRPYWLRGAIFEASEDLMQVPGISYDLYVKLKDFVTVFGDSAGVDDRQAPIEVLQVLAGGQEAIARRIAQQRETGLAAMDTSMLDKAFVHRVRGRYLRVDAQLNVDGIAFSRSRWVQRGKKSLEPWETLVAETAYRRTDEQAVDSR